MSMRIDTYMQVNQLYNSNKTRNNVKTGNASKRDSLEISDFGSAFQYAKEAVGKSSDVRMDKVNDIKARLDNGTYNVSLEDVAEKMVDSLLA